MQQTSAVRWSRLAKTALLPLAALAALGPVALTQGAAPVRGGALSAAYNNEPASLDPARNNALRGDVYNLFYETLWKQERDGRFTPLLALSWRISADRLSVAVKLRQGVRFHDGTPWNAEAAVFNLRRLIAAESTMKARLGVMRSVEANGPFDITIRLSEPSAPFMSQLAVESGLMVSPAAVARSGEDFGRRPVGTGPFRFVEWVSGDRIVGERWDGYWRRGADNQALPYLDRVTVRFIPLTATKLIELQADRLQLADTVTPREFAGVEANNRLGIVPGTTQTIQFLTFNLTRAPFNNERLRKAVLYGLDRKAMSDAITGGRGTVASSLFPSASWVYDADLKGYGLDPERARGLVRQAAPGGSLQATMSIIQRDPDTQVAQIIQAQLAQIGVNVRIESLERSAWIEKVLAHNYDLALLQTAVPGADPDIPTTQFSRQTTFDWAGLKNVNDARLFEAFDKARVVAGQAARKTYYNLGLQVLQDRAYYGFLFYRPTGFPASDRLRNLAESYDANGAWYLGDVWLTR